MSEAASDRTATVAGILDAIEQTVTGARAMPMSSSVIVSRAELLALLDEVRQVLPEQLSMADEVIADADAARSLAREEADALVAAARQQAAALVEADAVVEAARQRAAEVLAQAQAQAVELRRDADDYCDRRLADFEIDLGKVLSQVQAGRAKLADRLGPPG
jgi:DNA repair protein RadC